MSNPLDLQVPGQDLPLRNHNLTPVLMRNEHDTSREPRPYYFVRNHRHELCGIWANCPSYSSINLVEKREDGWWLLRKGTIPLDTESAQTLLQEGRVEVALLPIGTVGTIRLVDSNAGMPDDV